MFRRWIRQPIDFIEIAVLQGRLYRVCWRVEIGKIDNPAATSVDFPADMQFNEKGVPVQPTARVLSG